ncbi:MAG: tRNA pseudouridine(38-40) synthase TruA [Eubacteriales bacterium]|jgi:tRNA pseudouridine38-40 synthase
MKTGLVISYKGSAYCGWQIQTKAKKPSVQKTLQNAVESTFGIQVSLTGCSRTDSGVHAKEFYCHLDKLISIDNEKIPLAVNRNLPSDICVNRAFDADDSFHSRYSAKGKEYMYLIWNSKYKNVFHTDTAFMYPKYIDVDELNKIGKDFEGTHDFSAFVSANTTVSDFVRTVWYFRAERDGDFVKIYTAADGFLYNMVRIMVGTSIDILTGGVSLPVKEIIESKQRGKAGRTMPPHGLYLNRVFY